MNNFIKARPAQKHSVATNREPNGSDTPKGLSKMEGILTSPIKLKELKEEAYYWAFFQLEGIEQDIPVIFRIKKNPFIQLSALPISGYERPEIPSRAKVLLIGEWAESLNSNRPSFTCSEFRILEPPKSITIKDLREQISSLLTTSLEKKQEWNQRTDYLFRKQKDLSEIDKLTKLGSEYLSAYLLLRRAFYANYQDNLLADTAHLTHQEEYLAKISSEIEEIAHHIRAYEAKEL